MSSEEPIITGLGMRICLQGISRRFSAVPQISTNDFFKMWQERENQTLNNLLLLIDIRQPCEQNVSFIPGCRFLNADDDVTKNVDKVKEFIKTYHNDLSDTSENQSSSSYVLNVVSYCSIGYRSSLLTNYFVSDPVSPSEMLKVNFYNLKGSIFKWANEGRPIVRSGDQVTKFVHPFNMVWGKLLNEDLKKWD